MSNENSKLILKLIKDHIIPVLKQESGEGDSKGFSYVQQRAMINQIFKSTSNENYNQQSIMLRLIVIDSLYSTNAAYSYFSFEHMAEQIYSFGKNEEKAAEYFYALVTKEGMEDGEELFSSNYGIRKNLTDGSKQMSLMSKYAYYVLLQNPKKYPLGFPIYDSLAIEMYPKVCEKLDVNPQFAESAANNNKLTITGYISALNELRKNIFEKDADLYEGYQQYDLLDAYLWRMGKLNNGNYSLLFVEDEYKKFITNIELNKKKGEELFDKFNMSGLISKNIKKTKTNKETISYTYDFNKLVRCQCATMEVENILKGINNGNLSAMISHWKQFYLENQELFFTLATI